MYLRCLSAQMVVSVFLSSSAASLSHTCPFPSQLLTPCPTALDVVTPPLDGTILPGVTRDSVLSLLSHTPHTVALPKLPTDVRIQTAERPLTMSELFAAAEAGTLREVFCVGTAAVVIPASRIGWQRRVSADGVDADSDSEMQIQDIVLPVVGGEGSLAHVLWERLVDIQEGRVEWEGWGVLCDDATA